MRKQHGMKCDFQKKEKNIKNLAKKKFEFFYLKSYLTKIEKYIFDYSTSIRILGIRMIDWIN